MQTKKQAVKYLFGTVKSLLTIVFLLSVSSQIFAQINASDQMPLKVFGDTLHFAIGSPSCFIDYSNNLNFPEIQEERFDRQYPALYKELSANHENKTFWLKFGILNKSDREINLHLYCGSIDFINLYLVSAGLPLKVIKGGSLRSPGSGLSFEEKMAGTIPLQLRAHQQAEVFVSLKQKTQEFDFDGIELYDQNAFYSSFYKDYESDRYFTVFQILFQGFILCQLLFILFQWVIIRLKEYFYYFLYLSVISLYFLSKYESLYGIDLLFTRFPLLTIYLGKTLLIVPYFLYFRFIRSFLDIPSQYKTLNKWIVGVEHFLLAYAVFDFVFIFTTFNQRLQSEIFVFVILLVFILAISFIIYLFRKRQTLIYYILLGSLFVGIGNVLGLISTYLADDTSIILGFHNMLLFSQIGIILEISCFTVGLGYKSHIAEKEKIKSQNQLIEQLKTNEILQMKMQNIRNDIAQDLHDDIGSTLSSISILSELILKQSQIGNTSEMIHEIRDSSMILLEKMDDIIWSINPKNDSLEKLLLRIKHFASRLFEARQIDYDIIIQENIGLLKFPMDFRQHIYLILKESINNLVKYSKATRAIIEIGFDQHVFELRVKDNGIGFDLSDGFEGNGILSMKNRAAVMNAELTIHTKRNKGTEVHLKVKID